MSFGGSVLRDRRKQIPDPVNPSRTTLGAWDDAETITIAECFVDSQSSSSTNDATRDPVSTTKTLHCANAFADVRVGDRIRVGSEVFYVRERPEADANPFTGWQPYVSIPLSMEEG